MRIVALRWMLSVVGPSLLKCQFRIKKLGLLVSENFILLWPHIIHRLIAKSSIDHVLQVTRCFLPHHFKRRPLVHCFSSLDRSKVQSLGPHIVPVSFTFELTYNSNIEYDSCRHTSFICMCMSRFQHFVAEGGRRREGELVLADRNPRRDLFPRKRREARANPCSRSDRRGSELWVEVIKYVG